MLKVVCLHESKTLFPPYATLQPHLPIQHALAPSKEHPKKVEMHRLECLIWKRLWVGFPSLLTMQFKWSSNCCFGQWDGYGFRLSIRGLLVYYDEAYKWRVLPLLMKNIRLHCIAAEASNFSSWFPTVDSSSVSRMRKKWTVSMLSSKILPWGYGQKYSSNNRV